MAGSSAPITETGGPALPAGVDEVQAVFSDNAALERAIGHLEQSGFDRADISLPTANPSMASATPEQGAANPTTASDAQQVRTLQTSLAGSVGAMAAAGAVIATGGAALPAVVAAAAVGAGVGGLTHAASSATTQSDRDEKDRAASEGRLVLSVRITSDARRQTAENALRQGGAVRVEAIRREGGAIKPAA